MLLRGILVGLAVAAPVGPIGLLCIRRSLEHGPGIGFATGVGAAVADTFYGALAAFGVQAALDVLIGYETALKLVGGVILLLVAAKDFASRPAQGLSDAPDANTLLEGFGTALLLTLTNPLTIMAFVAIFATLGLGSSLGPGDAWILVSGVFLGSAGWWLMLSNGVALLRHRITDRLFLLLYRGAALALAGFGVYALVSALGGYATVASLAVG